MTGWFHTERTNDRSCSHRDGARMFFEEFQVGQRYTSGTREVTAADLESFTRLSGDDHPLHTDPEYAAGTRFGEPILQGTFGFAVAGGLWSRLGLVRDSIV